LNQNEIRSRSAIIFIRKLMNSRRGQHFRLPLHYMTKQPVYAVCMTALLQQLQQESLIDERRHVNRLALLYKISNEQLSSGATRQTWCHREWQTGQRKCDTTETLHTSLQDNWIHKSFSPRTILEWNSLPNAITSAAWVSLFRSFTKLSCFTVSASVFCLTL